MSIIKAIFGFVLVAAFAGCQPAPELPPTVRTPSLPLPAGGLIPPMVRWNSATLNKIDLLRLDKLIDRYRRTEPRYVAVQGLRHNGVPAQVVFGFHYREADNDFSTHLANGDPLTHRTYHVPKGRIPGVPPPYKWEQGAEDALYTDGKEDRVNWHSLTLALRAIEAYNGVGYALWGKPSPYLWSGTNIYSRGKFVSDGKYDPLAVDKQLGIAAVLLRMQERGMKLPF